jgi:hypothetical protein
MATAGADDDDAKALDAAFRRLLDPLARLAVGRGVPYAAIDDLLRAAFVRAAYESHPDVPAHRRASRVSAATGLHRREVQRLLAHDDPAAVPARSLAAEVFAHWRSHDDYVQRDRQPRVLPRTGATPSFESLAQTITRDVHPRTLLEELLRLGLARHDTNDDTVTLAHTVFVPRGDSARMVGFLGANVGDHLRGAVANVLGQTPQHFEQAVFADGLSDASLDELRPLISAQWRAAHDQLVSTLERLIERDRAGSTPGTHRVRVGLYSFQERVSSAATPAEPALAAQPAKPAKPVRRRSKTPSTTTAKDAQAPRRPKASVRGSTS